MGDYVVPHVIKMSKHAEFPCSIFYGPKNNEGGVKKDANGNII